MSLFSLTLTFLLILDPVSHIVDFNFVLSELPTQRQMKVFFREMLIALAFLIGFYFLGAGILSTLHLTPATTRLAGGILLFIIAIKMIFPGETRVLHKPVGHEPFIVPLAIPMIVGAPILATMIFYANTSAEPSRVLTGIFLAWLITVITLWVCWLYRKHLNQKALDATERLMGLILTMLAVEMFLKGLRLFIWK